MEEPSGPEVFKSFQPTFSGFGFNCILCNGGQKAKAEKAKNPNPKRKPKKKGNLPALIFSNLSNSGVEVIYLNPVPGEVVEPEPIKVIDDDQEEIPPTEVDGEGKTPGKTRNIC